MIKYTYKKSIFIIIIKRLRVHHGILNGLSLWYFLFTIQGLLDNLLGFFVRKLFVLAYNPLIIGPHELIGHVVGKGKIGHAPYD